MAVSTNNDRHRQPTGNSCCPNTVHVLLRLALLALAKGQEHTITHTVITS